MIVPFAQDALIKKKKKNHTHQHTRNINKKKHRLSRDSALGLQKGKNVFQSFTVYTDMIVPFAQDASIKVEKKKKKPIHTNTPEILIL